MNADCSCRIFTEQLSELAARYARRTKRFEAEIYNTGYLLGGRPAVRECRSIGIQISRDTLLRSVRRSALSADQVTAKQVTVLGVDDWALRKGQRYGTILVDLEKHAPIDLLPDRRSETLVDWLKERTEIRVISRDRSNAYSEGARLGAPDAEQIADRWHILKNLVDAVERYLALHHKDITEAGKQAAAHPEAKDQVTVNPALKTMANRAIHGNKANELSSSRRDRRILRYEQVIDQYRKGTSLRQISCNLGIDRRTIRRFIKSDGYPERCTSQGRRNQQQKFHEYLKKRWDEGCHNASQLFREVKEQGYEGASISIRIYVRKWRAKTQDSTGNSSAGSTLKLDKLAKLSPRNVCWLLLGYPKNCSVEQSAINEKFLQKLLAINPDVLLVQDQALKFFGIIRERKPDDLKPWIDHAIACKKTGLSGFAFSLQRDYNAVLAGISNPWSNGQTEGQVNRLKLLKRSMYGRAKLDLLKARILPPAILV